MDFRTNGYDVNPYTRCYMRFETSSYRSKSLETNSPWIFERRPAVYRLSHSFTSDVRDQVIDINAWFQIHNGFQN